LGETDPRWRLATKVALVAFSAPAVLLLFWRYPPVLLPAVLALAPVAAIVLSSRSKGVVSLSGVADPSRVSAFLLGVLPAMLAFRAAQDLNPVSLPLIIAVGLGGGLVLTGLFWLADQRTTEDLGLLAFLIFCLSCSAGGLILDLNVRADTATPTTYRAVVTERWMPMKRSGHKLRLTAWGPMPAGQAANVPKDVYWDVKVGDTVCPQLRPGALDLAWYDVKPCP
jgi:hypothetical protein